MNFVYSNQQYYRIEKIVFDTGGLFDSCIDATCILTMEDSNRRQQYMEQLQKFKPSKYVYIFHNKGYKNCIKKCFNGKIITDASADIIDSYMNMLNIMNKYNFKRILSLEDDFLFLNRTIDEPIHVKRISNFLNCYNPDIYSLGNTFHLNPFFNPLSYHHQPSYISMSHALFIDVQNVVKLFNFKELRQCHKWLHVDAHVLSRSKNKWFYYKPICVQKLSKTENRIQNWNYLPSNIIINLFNMENSIDGWDNLYHFYSTINCILFFFIVYTLYKLFNKKLNIKKK